MASPLISMLFWCMLQPDFLFVLPPHSLATTYRPGCEPYPWKCRAWTPKPHRLRNEQRNVPEGPKPQDTAERRQVTVMFSDLVGSTALAARMDPEDLREVISGYQKCVAETVQRFGGFVAKYMGDGVLVYFGYPQAHEDDAERAVRAGLQLDQRFRSSNHIRPPCRAYRPRCERRAPD